MKRLASLFSLLLLSVILLSLSSCSSCKHEWIDATCKSPKTCKLCDETEGKKLKHEWLEATCIEPKTCKLCNKTKGEALGHSIVQDDAVAPTCTDEGFTEGEHCEVCEMVLIAQEEIPSLGHTWNDATCITPKTCEECGKTRGKALGHDSEWIISYEATLTSKGKEKLICSVCDSTIDNRYIDKKTPQVKSDSFNFKDKELIDWINDISTAEIGYTELEVFDNDNTSYPVTFSDGQNGCLIFNHGNNGKNGDINVIMFYSENNNSAGALAIWLASKIDSDFSANDAINTISNGGKTYTDSNMTITQLYLDTDFLVYVLAPSEKLAEILS